ncbi:MAG: helix-turn-helix domain-containing protein [Acidobacteriota bacterium]
MRELKNVIDNAAILCEGSRIKPEDLHLDFSVSEKNTLRHLAENKLSLEEIEKLYIQEILNLTNGNRSKAAKILGINRKTLLEKRKKYNLIE